MAIKYLDQINVSNKKVMIRADFNVPYDKNMNITDDTRITQHYLLLNIALHKMILLYLFHI